LRRLITTLLATLIFACPFLCGADKLGHGVQCGCAAGDEGRDGPDQCPEGGDSCVCQGAVQSADVRAVTPSCDAALPLYVFVPQPPLIHSPHHLTRDGAPTGLAGWGDSLNVRAYLQNFRF